MKSFCFNSCGDVTGVDILKVDSFSTKGTVVHSSATQSVTRDAKRPILLPSRDGKCIDTFISQNIIPMMFSRLSRIKLGNYIFVDVRVGFLSAPLKA